MAETPDATQVSPSTSIGWRAAILITAAAVAGVGLWHAQRFFDDDAYITLRYAARLLDGYGPTWNDGERVEGYSHPLWLAQIVALGLFRIDLPLATRALGIASLAGILLIWWRSGAWMVALLPVASLAGIAIWSVGGLETVGYCFWILLAVWLVRRAVEDSRTGDRRASRTALEAGLALAGVALMRPEGPAVAVAALAGFLGARTGRVFLVALAGFAIPVAAHLLWRVSYYGDLIANAARAKAGSLPLPLLVEQSLGYFRTTAPEWLGAILVAVAMFATSRDRRSATWMLLPALPLLGLVFAGGGDHMPGARLLLPPVVLIVFAAASAGPPRSRGARVGISALAVAVACWQTGMLVRHPPIRDAAATVGEIVGRALERELEPGSLVTTSTAGSVPYFAPSLRFIDTLGLSDRWIARRSIDRVVTTLQRLPGHSKGDGVYILRRKPDAIILGGADGVLGYDATGYFLSDYELLTRAEFRSNYWPYLFHAPIPPRLRGHVRVRQMIDRATGTYPYTVYLRNDSPAAQRMAMRGIRLQPPWLRGASRSPSSAR